MTDLPDVTNYPEPIVDELAEIIKPYSWQDFENTVDGHRKITLADPELQTRFRGVHFDFYLRVGTFMTRPMRVVIACGKYVWMKVETIYSAYPLCALDPLHPENGLYASGFIDAPLGWRPFNHAYAVGAFQQLQKQQILQQQQQPQAQLHQYQSTIYGQGTAYPNTIGPTQALGNPIGLGYAPTLPGVK